MQHASMSPDRVQRLRAKPLALSDRRRQLPARPSVVLHVGRMMRTAPAVWRMLQAACCMVYALLHGVRCGVLCMFHPARSALGVRCKSHQHACSPSRPTLTLLKQLVLALSLCVERDKLTPQAVRRGQAGPSLAASPEPCPALKPSRSGSVRAPYGSETCTPCQEVEDIIESFAESDDDDSDDGDRLEGDARDAPATPSRAPAAVRNGRSAARAGGMNRFAAYIHTVQQAAHTVQHALGNMHMQRRWASTGGGRRMARSRESCLNCRRSASHRLPYALACSHSRTHKRTHDRTHSR